MRLTKNDLVTRSDLREREVDLPTLGGTVKVRSLPAAYSNQAMTDAQETNINRHGEQSAKINVRKLEEIKVLHGLIDPKLDNGAEVRAFAEHCGPAWNAIVKAIDEISGVDQESVEKIEAQFPAGGPGEGRPVVADAHSNGQGTGRPDLPARTGA
jgi:hypothetical protein